MTQPQDILISLIRSAVGNSSETLPAVGVRGDGAGKVQMVWRPGIVFKIRCWCANGWKYGLAFKESRLSSFITQIWGHLLKPENLKN